MPDFEYQEYDNDSGVDNGGPITAHTLNPKSLNPKPLNPKPMFHPKADHEKEGRALHRGALKRHFQAASSES